MLAPASSFLLVHARYPRAHILHSLRGGKLLIRGGGPIVWEADSLCSLWQCLNSEYLASRPSGQDACAVCFITAEKGRSSEG